MMLPRVRRVPAEVAMRRTEYAALVDQARELLLAARVDVVGADGDGRLRRLRAQPEERPGT